jgi:uncharacterized protein
MQLAGESMQVTGEQRIDAPREVVWAALHDPDILRRCIPGCERVDRVSDTEMCAVATTTINSVETRFNSTVTLSAMDPPAACRIAAESQGGPAGFASGGADVRLEPVGAASTLLTYELDATVGGKLAQLGESLINQTANKMARDFFARLNDTLTGPATERMAVTEPAALVPEGFGAAFWLAITMVLITLALYAMALL